VWLKTSPSGERAGEGKFQISLVNYSHVKNVRSSGTNFVNMMLFITTNILLN
jgi:hypothetical protein